MPVADAPPDGGPTPIAITDGPVSPLDTALDIAIPVGLAVVTWLAVLLAVGVTARAGSLLDALPLFFVALLLWPVLRAAPWREGSAARARAWARANRDALAIAVGLAVLPVLPPVPDLVVTVLELPYRGTSVFFGASLPYRDPLGRVASRSLLRFGQWSFQALWLYLLATGLLAAGRRLR